MKHKERHSHTKIHYEGYSEDETHKHQQTDMIMEAHRQMMTALFLPTPEIPKFRGDPLEFTRFISAFDTRISSRVSSYSDKLYYLEQQLEGEPKDLIGGCLFMEPEDGYNEARSLLKCKYGDTVKIAMAYVNKIRYWPRIKDNDPHGLRTLSYFLTTCNCAMKRVSYMDMLNHAPNLQVIVTKLPLYLQDEWCDKAYDMIQELGQVTFEDMVKFVARAPDRVNNPIYGLEAMKDAGYGKIQTPQMAPHQQVTNCNEQKTRLPESDCVLCFNRHTLDRCKQFLEMTIEAKQHIIKEHGLCFGCLGRNHISRECTQKHKCQKCGKHHPTALHIDNF